MPSSSPPVGAGLRRFYEQHRADLEDFWARAHSRPRHERELSLFGRTVRFLSNEAGALAAADLCGPLYSAAPPAGEAPLTIQLVVQPAPVPPGPAPADLPRRIQYTGDGDWMAMLLGAWGYCHIDVPRAQALAVLTPELAARPDLVSQWVLNTIITNLFMARGLAMLHATCLVRQDRALLLMAPHNSGKSTTALRLALAGCRVLTDSQVYVGPAATPLGVQLLGFPVGHVKLRADMAQDFPELRPLLEAQRLRNETKFALDLREYDPALVQDTAVQPAAVDVCLLRRVPAGRTRLTPLAGPDVLREVVLNSLQTHTDAVWERNLAALEPLVQHARWHRLEMGPASDGLVQTLQGLWG